MAAGTLNRTGAKRFYARESGSLEQQETGEIRRLRCADCGQRWFESWEQLRRHQLVCRRNETESGTDAK